MSFGGGSSGSAPSYTGLQLPTSSSTLPIAVGWGRFSTSWNLVWYANFQLHQANSGGKGFGGGGSQQSSYSADLMGALCEGPVASVARVWQGSSVWLALPKIGLSLFAGAATQTPWPYLASHYPNQTLSYGGTAYVAGANINLGTEANMPSYTFEVVGTFAGTGANGVDADPALVIQDFLTNRQYGANFPAAALDLTSLLSGPNAGSSGDSALQTYCKAAGLAISPLLSSSETAISVLQRLCKLLNCAAVWSEGLLKFIPFGDARLGTVNAQPHRYWRLSFTGGWNDPQFEQLVIAHAQLRAASGGANIATGGTASDSAHSPGYPASGAFAGTRLWISGVERGPDSWIEYDLGAGHASEVVEVAITANSVTGTPNGAPADVQLLWSDDGQQFTPAGFWGPLSWSSGQTQVFTVTAGFGAIFVPDTNPVHDLTDADFEADPDADPVSVAIADITEAKNILRLTINDRANWYSSSLVEARDENAVNLYGPQIDTSVSANEICDQTVASTIASILLQRGLYIRRTFSFKLGWRFGLLEPMDIVTLTDPRLGLTAFPVRIMTIEEDDQDSFSVTAEEFIEGLSTAAITATQSAAGNSFNADSAAGPVNPPVILEPTPDLTGGAAQIWLALSGANGGVADANWGGANIYLSTDGETFSPLGEVLGPARQGVLTQPLAAFSGSGADTSHTLSVDLTQSGGQLISGSAASAAGGQPLCYADGELFAFETATLTGLGQYDLTRLHRGLYGTTAGAHAAGTQFARLDAAIYKYDLPPAQVGIELFFKFQSFNIQRGGEQDLSTCAMWSYTPTGAGFSALEPVYTPAGTVLMNSAGALVDILVLP